MSRFKDQATEDLWEGKPVRRLDRGVRKQAQRRLQILIAAVSLDDLKVPPSNKLEALKGDRKGYHSIRVNAQYRLCFKWAEDEATEIEFVDYH
ncbi:type II toxin-antitoxin system RelE/ParE family toxin [Chryseolinea sp. H1M3-3]|uniref:type II toxin-antitoxin system RelE/ParE family toxin n=1 Tax=Chryseolinea sp. H1M3-3 TaxID=3034144 RepID=UPI0023EDEF81|nr:type II toxin-antitoxin system RelE/ParE family toxin [Chryseolinea sp. H1M3-3]